VKKWTPFVKPAKNRPGSPQDGFLIARRRIQELRSAAYSFRLRAEACKREIEQLQEVENFYKERGKA